MRETVFTNAAIVTSDRVIAGTLTIRDGLIADVSEGRSSLSCAMDCDGDFLLPGLVELHTDNLEHHFAPRPGVLWHGLSAAIAHDAAVATSGITTVLDALAVGDVRQDSNRISHLVAMVEAIADARSQRVLRVDHLLHLRCEISYASLIETYDRFAAMPALRLVSIMDHTPGQRQFAKLDQYYLYYKGKFGFTDEEMTGFIELQIANQQAYSAANRRAIVARCHDAGIPLASHDDASAEHVNEAAADGMVIAEFPTTVEAARLSQKAGMKVLMGAPNLVRGGSHSGNVSAVDLAHQGLLEIISSDYIPSSLMQSVFLLHRKHGMALPEAVAKASLIPAQAIGLTDRGEIAPAKRGDVVRVSEVGAVPVVREVWAKGARVA
jgi:alpha-D-ribose 1-methylphosphonate 5-triphosphate diphosphatase